MRIIEIQVTAGRTFNHPHESYSNLRPEVRLTATLAGDNDADSCVRELQAKAEAMVEDHKTNLLKSIEDLQLLTERQAEMVSLEKQLRAAQKRLEEIRTQYPEQVKTGIEAVAAFPGYRGDDLGFTVGLPGMEQLNHHGLQLGLLKARRGYIQFTEIALDLRFGRRQWEDGQNIVDIVDQIRHIHQFNKKIAEGQHQKRKTGCEGKAGVLGSAIIH